MAKKTDRDIQKEEVQKIAKLTLGIETLETRNMDDLDFYQLSVYSIKKALYQAYLAGKCENLGKK